MEDHFLGIGYRDQKNETQDWAWENDNLYYKPKTMHEFEIQFLLHNIIYYVTQNIQLK